MEFILICYICLLRKLVNLTTLSNLTTQAVFSCLSNSFIKRCYAKHFTIQQRKPYPFRGFWDPLSCSPPQLVDDPLYRLSHNFNSVFQYFFSSGYNDEILIQMYLLSADTSLHIKAPQQTKYSALHSTIQCLLQLVLLSYVGKI